MRVTESQRRLLALCAIRDRHQRLDWSVIAREVQLDKGLDSLWAGELRERSVMADASLMALRAGIQHPKALFLRVDDELAAAEEVGASLVTVLDDAYPSNLRLVSDLPPFLFVRGEIRDDDIRSVAIVGAADASPTALERARCALDRLAARRITLVSGLASGLDLHVHRAAMEGGWRSLAILASGIACCAREHREVANEIPQRGALISPFWATRSPGPSAVHQRDILASGLSQGTLLTEESGTTNARRQIRIALQHGRKVFVLGSVIAARRKSHRAERSTVEVHHVDEIVRQLPPPERVQRASEQRRQLRLAQL